VNGFGTNMRVMKELTCSKEIWEEGIVVETPYPVGSSRFKEIQGLYSAGKGEISK
jgi:hypothetical protein